MGKPSASLTRSSASKTDLGSADTKNYQPLFSSSGPSSQKTLTTLGSNGWDIFKLKLIPPLKWHLNPW